MPPEIPPIADVPPADAPSSPAESPVPRPLAGLVIFDVAHALTSLPLSLGGLSEFTPLESAITCGAVIALLGGYFTALYFLWRGFSWARSVVLAVSILGLISVCFPDADETIVQKISSWISFSIAVAWWVLLTRPQIRDYFKLRTKHKETELNATPDGSL